MALATIMCLATARAAAQQHSGQFEYPTVPDSLHTPTERAEYVLAHYWDNFCFADTTLMHQPEITEQGFANFIDLLPRVAPATAATGIKALADRLYATDSLGTTASMREYFESLAEKYLGQDDSPLHNDMLYAQFLDVMGANKYASVAERTRNSYMARNLRKNLPGTVAADFEFVDRHGAHRRLSSFAAQYTVLLFYDPYCDRCHSMARQMASMPLLAEGSLFRVLAVYAYDETDRWREAANSFPASWTDAYSPDGYITAHDIYYIKQMPSVYLLDSDKRVLLKNPDFKLLSETVLSLAGQQAEK